MMSVLQKAGVPFKIEELATKKRCGDRVRVRRKIEKSSETGLTKRKSVL
jgi:hypothetical protein